MEVLNKLFEYLQGEFGLLQGVGFSSIAMFANPAIILKLNNFGLVILILSFLLSLVQSRFYGLFFIFVLLNADLPSFKDKPFWLSVIFFSFIIGLWFVLEAQRVDWWVEKYGY